MSDIAVVGAGLTGSLLAIRLAVAGHAVTLFDKRSDGRGDAGDGERSINLAISTRGLDALSRVEFDGRGLDSLARAEAIPMDARLIHDRDGQLTRQPYGIEPHHTLYSVSRDSLNRILLDAVDATQGIEVCFEHRVRDVSVRRPDLTLDTPEGRHRRRFDVVFGADGAYSAVRGRLQRTGRVDFSQRFSTHGYKELRIDADADGRPRLDPSALHIWPRGEHMMIALPNSDGSFTATLFWPHEVIENPEPQPSPDVDLSATRIAFADIVTADAVQDAFARDFGDAAALITDLGDQYLANPVGSLVTIETGPWHHAGRVLVLGDAAHAVVPFYGQGANAALEDVTLLMEHYERLGFDEHAAVFQAFYLQRKPDTDALARLAVEHHDEMRDRVRSRRYLAQAWLERLLHRVAPTRFVPLYTMVSFTRMPYASAVARSHRQRTRMRQLALITITVVVAAIIALGLWVTA